MMFPRSCPRECTGPSVVPQEDPGLGPGAMGEEAGLGISLATPGLGATLGPPLFLCCPTVPSAPLLGRGPGVGTWAAVGVHSRFLGLGDNVGGSGTRAVFLVVRTRAVTPSAADRPRPVGLTTSPARHSHCQTPAVNKQMAWPLPGKMVRKGGDTAIHGSAPSRSGPRGGHG